MITSINIDGALLLIGSHQKEQVRIQGNIPQITFNSGLLDDCDNCCNIGDDVTCDCSYICNLSNFSCSIFQCSLICFWYLYWAKPEFNHLVRS